MIRLHFERPSGASGSAGNDDSALASPESCESLSDAQLLETFRQYEASATAAASDRERGEAAFAELVRRHQGLVYGVCRRVLGDPHAAEDAFQATFLVLARKTHTIRDDASLPSWLHRVAFRIALRARQREGKTPDLLEDCDSLEQAERQLRDIVNRETCQAVDEELQRLPEQQRRLVLLCTLEGLSYRQAAKRLGLTRNQVKWGLSRAREALKIRLARRGFAFSLGMLTVVSLHRSAQASRPELIRRTAELAVQFKGPTALTPPTYSTAISLAHEGLHAMLLTKLKTCLLATAAAVLFVGGPLVLTSTSASPGGWFGSFAVQDEEREQEERRDRGRGDRREDDRRDERNERRDQDDRRERGERRERDERGAAEGHYRLRERDREGERRGAGEMRREGDRGPERRGDMRNRRPGQEEGRPEWMQELERARRAAAEAREVAGRLRRENEERLNQARAQERRFNEQRAEVEELRQLLEQTRRVAERDQAEMQRAMQEAEEQKRAALEAAERVRREAENELERLRQQMKIQELVVSRARDERQLAVRLLREQREQQERAQRGQMEQRERAERQRLESQERREQAGTVQREVLERTERMMGLLDRRVDEQNEEREELLDHLNSLQEMQEELMEQMDELREELLEDEFDDDDDDEREEWREERQEEELEEEEVIQELSDEEYTEMMERRARAPRDSERLRRRERGQDRESERRQNRREEARTNDLQEPFEFDMATDSPKRRDVRVVVAARQQAAKIQQLSEQKLEEKLRSLMREVQGYKKMYEVEAAKRAEVEKKLQLVAEQLKFENAALERKLKLVFQKMQEMNKRLSEQADK